MNQMSKRLQDAIQNAKSWPVDRQDDAAQILEQMHALTAEPYRLTEDERADITRAIDEISRGELADEIEVLNLRRKFGA